VGLLHRHAPDQEDQGPARERLHACFGWGFCTVTLQTKKIKGLHENDFIMAAKINALAGA
jgi:hypothetical protein